MSFEVLILAGGSGTRLWPASDGNRPKQFLAFPKDKTLIEQAVERALLITDLSHVWIITLQGQIPSTLEVLPAFPREQVISEPVGRNSAPAITTATFWIESLRKQPVTLLVVTADHLISDQTKFAAVMKKGLERAAKGESLVTFGLKMTEPRTEYGYIEIEKSNPKAGILSVKRFVEKPTLQNAKKFLKTKRFLWNSGMFAWRTDFFRKEMSRFAPTVFNPLQGIRWQDPKDQLSEIYPTLPNISIDYALMEKTKAAEVVPSNFSWSDVGTWLAVHEATPKDKAKNAVVGNGRVIDGKRNLIYSHGKPISLFGVDDLVVVQTEQVTLVTTRQKSTGLKNYLEKMKKLGIDT